MRTKQLKTGQLQKTRFDNTTFDNTTMSQHTTSQHLSVDVFLSLMPHDRVFAYALDGVHIPGCVHAWINSTESASAEVSLKEGEFVEG